MKIFIENETGSLQKSVFDETKLEYKRTDTVSAPYPFPYGFVVGTISPDGNNLDCFILTSKPLKSSDIIEAEPIGMFEQTENDVQDPKILAVLKGESWLIDEQTMTVLKNFMETVFSHVPNKVIKVGRFLDKVAAIALLTRSQASTNNRPI